MDIIKNHPKKMINTKVLMSSLEKMALKSCETIPGFSMFNSDVVDHRIYILALIDGEVAGIAQMVENSSRIPNAIGIGFIETHIDYRNRGVAKAIVEQLFSLAKELGKNIANTSYEPDGVKWLEPLIQAKSDEYPEVHVYERDEYPSKKTITP